MPKELTDDDIRVVLAYADNNMKATGAGRKLFLHENTVQYHLNVVEKKTGMSPRKFYDLIKLVEMLKERRGEDG